MGNGKNGTNRIIQALSGAQLQTAVERQADAIVQLTEAITTLSLAMADLQKLAAVQNGRIDALAALVSRETSSDKEPTMANPLPGNRDNEVSVPGPVIGGTGAGAMPPVGGPENSVNIGRAPTRIAGSATPGHAVVSFEQAVGVKPEQPPAGVVGETERVQNTGIEFGESKAKA